MKKKRPVYLDLTTMHFPVTAIASILHRISGVVIFISLPYFFWLLQKSFTPYGFVKMKIWLHEPMPILMTWIFLVAWTYHIFAGLRHIIMDLGWAESLRGGRVSAYVTMFATVILGLLIGIWLW